MFLTTWNDTHTSFSYETTVRASNASLNELHREIGSAVHMLGTEGRRVAESLGLRWTEYAQHILKKPLSSEAISDMTLEEQQAVEDNVVHIISENTPRPLEQRPTTLHGITISHDNVSDTCDVYDLFTVV
jgi:hypothetical protein